MQLKCIEATAAVCISHSYVARACLFTIAVPWGYLHQGVFDDTLFTKSDPSANYCNDRLRIQSSVSIMVVVVVLVS